jgi:hypothetical protein
MNVEVYGMISICLFVAVFTGALIWAAVQKKPFLKSMSTLPLDEGDNTVDSKDKSHE